MTPPALRKVKYDVIFHEVHLWSQNSIHEIEYHPCPQCDYKARQSQHLRQHVKLFIKVLPTHVTCVTTKHLQNPVSIVTS